MVNAPFARPGILGRVSEQRPERRYTPEFDVLRGAAIVAVVYLHAYFTPWPGASRDGLILLHIAHLFAHGAVPLFLFVSAYLQAAGAPESPWQHLRRRALTIWAPVGLWMAAALAYRLATEGSSSGLWRDLALFNISGQFYFVWLLLVFGLALTQAHRLPLRWLDATVVAAFVLNLAVIGWYESHGHIDGLFATLAYRNPLAWVFFPLLGYRLGRAGLTRPPAFARNGALALMGAAGLVYLWMGAARGYWPVSYFGVTVFLFSAAAMLIYPLLALRLLESTPVARPLAWLSRYSFPIYLVHLPFAIGLGTRELLGDGASWSNYWLLLHANAFVGLFVSLAVVRELEKLSPRVARIALGIRRRPRRTGAAAPHADPRERVEPRRA